MSGTGLSAFSGSIKSKSPSQTWGPHPGWVWMWMDVGQLRGPKWPRRSELCRRRVYTCGLAVDVGHLGRGGPQLYVV